MICDKISFDNIDEANEALKSCKKARKEGDKTRKEKRVYVCKVCGKFHLTSKVDKTDLFTKKRVSTYGKAAINKLKIKHGELPKFEKIIKRGKKLE